VVSIDHEGMDARFIESLESILEFDLCPKASIRPIIDVTCHQQKIHLLLKAELNDPVKGLKCGRTQDASQIWVINAKCCKGAVEMEIGCVNKREIGHLRPSNGVQND
jgi:hypothetical protein